MEETYIPIDTGKWYSTAKPSPSLVPNTDDLKQIFKDMTNNNYILDESGNYVYRDKVRTLIILGIVFALLCTPLIQRLISFPLRYYIGQDFRIIVNDRPTALGMIVLVTTFIGISAFIL